jgi:hypothetical protein
MKAKFYRCGECGRRFDSEQEIREHIAEKDAEGDSHDGTSWSECGDEIAIVARAAQLDNEYGESQVPWSFFGRWRFSEDTDIDSDESIGFTVRTLLRQGYVDVRVLHLNDAEALFESTRKKE